MEFVLRTGLGTFQPNADVFVDEEARRVVVVLEVAGAEPESLRVAFDDGCLVAAGRRRESRLRRGSFIRKEIVHGEFVKRIPLPIAIDYEAVAASYEDGLLVVVAPIAATAYIPTSRTLHIMVKRTHS